MFSKSFSGRTILFTKLTFDSISSYMFGFNVIYDQSFVTGAVATVLTLIGGART